MVNVKFLPDTADRDEIEPAVRAALKADHKHATAQLNGISITLDYCAYLDGTPLLDKPLAGSLGAVILTRADGETIELPVDGMTWEALADEVEGLLDGWDGAVMEALSDAYAAMRKIEKLQGEIMLLERDRNRSIKRARELGISQYSVAKQLGKPQPTIARWSK